MKKFVAAILLLTGFGLATLSLAPQKPNAPALVLRAEGPEIGLQAVLANAKRISAAARPAGIFKFVPRLPAPNTPAFAHPIISGIGGTGFEESIRLDPTNPNRIYTSAPGTASADTSWIWHSLDGGKTFKWVVGALALEGKVTTCHGGGDTEIAVDSAGHLYFNDLTLANFSTARSDDFGATFTCSNTGVPDTVVDRQWYAVDGDPTNGGVIYLTNDEVGTGGASCPGTPTPGNNTLVMYRSPAVGAPGATAGVEFGLPKDITSRAVGCGEGIMGNNEISPIATTLGAPDGMGGFTTLPAPVKHVYVIHDNAALNQILIGRCFPVDLLTDPSGISCTDILVSDLGAGQKTGGDFPTMAIDRAGNLYAVWEQAPVAGSVLTGDVVLKFAYSTDQGNTWSTPIQIDTSGSPVGTLRENVFAWISAGDDGRVNIVWYGTPNTPSGGNNAPDDCNDCTWSVWMVQSLNAHAPVPTFTAPILASEHHVHRGAVQSLIGGQNQLSSRSLGDYLQMRTGPLGEAHIAYVDSNNIIGSAAGHAMYVRQNGGTGLYAATSPVNVSGIVPFNAMSDPNDDGKYEVNGTSSANMPQLDILNSSVTKVTTPPCSAVAPCYKVVMQLSDLTSLAPTPAQDPDIDLVWLTQWFVPSSTDPNGGKNFHAYAESTSGGALTCYAGENAIQLVGGGGVLVYPPLTTLPAANCQSTLAPNGNITIYVPLINVTEAGAIDNRLHEVTASTMTLQQPANSVPSFGGIGGVLFNLIDVAQAYVFDPALVKAVSRKTHGAAGTFDVDLPFSGGPGIECRKGQGANSDEHQIVITFATPVTLAGASVTSGTGNVSGTSTAVNEVTVNLTGIANAQTIAITLFGVNDGSGARNVSVEMGVIAGDTTANRSVNSADISQTKSQSGQAVTNSNFREDVTVDGSINSSDISFVKAKSGTALP